MTADSPAGLLVLFALTIAAATLLERLHPERPRARYLARGRVTDWLYWPFSALVTGNVTRVVVYGVLGLVGLRAGYAGARAELVPWLLAPRRGIGTWPLPAQFAAALAAGDLVSYWTHRLRHTPVLWPFHAVHHSPRTLDWLASVRMHPVDDALDNVPVGLAVLALGARLEVWLATGPALLFFNAWLHANTPLRLGPLRYLVATPAFHRLHHADDVAARPCNFAGVFPAWDLLFGTFRLPAAPALRYGPGDTPVPDGLLGQLVFPFRALARALAPPP